MEELGKKHENNMLYYDCESAIHIAKKSTFHSNTKHIQIMYHFMCFVLEDGHLKLVLVVDPDYLPDSEVLAFSRVYNP
jgi:hypothetical protein